MENSIILCDFWSVDFNIHDPLWNYSLICILNCFPWCACALCANYMAIILIFWLNSEHTIEIISFAVISELGLSDFFFLCFLCNYLFEWQKNQRKLFVFVRHECEMKQSKWNRLGLMSMFIYLCLIVTMNKLVSQFFCSMNDKLSLNNSVYFEKNILHCVLLQWKP